MRRVRCRERLKTRGERKTALIGTMVHWRSGRGAGCDFTASPLASHLRFTERWGVGVKHHEVSAQSTYPWTGLLGRTAFGMSLKTKGPQTLPQWIKHVGWSTVCWRLKSKLTLGYSTGNAVGNMVITLHGDRGLLHLLWRSHQKVHACWIAMLYIWY